MASVVRTTVSGAAIHLKYRAFTGSTARQELWRMPMFDWLGTQCARGSRRLILLEEQKAAGILITRFPWIP